MIQIFWPTSWHHCFSTLANLVPHFRMSLTICQNSLFTSSNLSSQFHNTKFKMVFQNYFTLKNQINSWILPPHTPVIIHHSSRVRAGRARLRRPGADATDAERRQQDAGSASKSAQVRRRIDGQLQVLPGRVRRQNEQTGSVADSGHQSVGVEN